MSYQLNHRQIAWRVAQDLVNAGHVALGTGLPQLVADYLPAGPQLQLHRDDSAERKPEVSSQQPDSSANRIPTAIDTLVLGAYQVAENGDLASWALPDAVPDAARENLAAVRKVLVMMEYFANDGTCNIVPECTMPVTAKGCVTTVYTDIAVIDLIGGSVVIRELIEGITLHTLQMETPVQLEVSSQLRLLQPPALN